MTSKIAWYEGKRDVLLIMIIEELNSFHDSPIEKKKHYLEKHKKISRRKMHHQNTVYIRHIHPNHKK